MKLSRRTRAQINLALHEDLDQGDRTTRLLISSSSKGKAVVLSKEEGVFCGKPVLSILARALDPQLRVRFHYREGEAFLKNRKVITLSGNIRSILALERTLLNFLAHLSGIATRTRQFVKKLKKYPVHVMDTRKTTPLWREIEKYAVRVGGGKNHRSSLSEEIFVKENHRMFGDLKKLSLRKRRFIIEVRNLSELERALPFKPRVILFDNFAVPALKKAARYVRLRDPQIRLEASGGITLQNVVRYAKTGVDQISIGSLTHSVRAIDFSLLLL